ncbi:MAG: peptide/nickel transport system ATP-binding protein [Thermotogaceae bacterium]|nr:peptide/nickel transport system ATP-binding protein [Thermotogaceae bacterium]
MSGKKLLEVRDLYTYYQTRLGEKIKAVNGVSFDLKEGEILGIAGESGCGKSTLGISISGLFPPPLKYGKGSVKLDDIELTNINQSRLRKEILGKKLSFIPQSAMNALNPTLKVKKFVIDLVKEHEPELSEDEILKRAAERFESLSLPRRVLDAYALELSGGMKQRTIVVISTMMNPEVVIADEPTSALDVSSQKIVIKLIKQLFEEKIIKSVIFITHELPILRHIATKIAVMYAGEFVEVGTMEQVIFDPVHPYSNALMNSIIVPEKGIKGKKLPSIPGAPPDPRLDIQGCRFAERCPLATEECKKAPIEMREVKGRLVRCIKV